MRGQINEAFPRCVDYRSVRADLKLPVGFHVSGGNFLKVTDHCRFSPMHFHAFSSGKKSAVPTVRGLHQRDLPVGQEGFARLLREANEWIVQRAQHQCGHGNAVKDAGCRGAIVVIAGIAKVAVARHYVVIEVAQRTNECEIGCGVNIGKERGLDLVTPQKPPQKVPLVKAVARRVQSVRADCQIDGWANGGYCAERRSRAPLTGELERKIAAHGVADKRYVLKILEPRVMLHYCAYVLGKTGVVE